MKREGRITGLMEIFQQPGIINENLKVQVTVQYNGNPQDLNNAGMFAAPYMNGVIQFPASIEEAKKFYVGKEITIFIE